MISCMAEIKDRLKADLTAAMKERDELRTRTLRMVLTALSTEEVAGGSARELSDDEVIKLLTREAKKRREAADAFDKGGRPEQAKAEREEGEVLAGYLPAQLTDAELSELVSAAIAEVGASDAKAMGKVMKVVNPKVAGRAEGGRVAAEVKKQLGA
ncbi:GatB/YqeY domain-containing protein [Nocardiopsis rhodophaea]